ncbi:MAG TPA: hypothetical protein VNC12_07095 [Solirubrobacteraceae bacterium]|nr:hypothetical protein [Solirubrobacteraceae bacterium]
MIEDARGRHDRERRRILTALVLVVAIAAAVAFALSDSGAATRYGVPAPGRVTGSLRSLGSADYQYWVTPTLNPGEVSLDISAQDAHSTGSCVGGCANYVGMGVPISEIKGDGGEGPRGPIVRAPLPHGADPNYVLLFPANVAAVRIGDLGTVGAEATPGLPVGDKVVAFRAPQNTTNGELASAPAQTLTTLDSRGHAIATLAPMTVPTTRAWVLRQRALYQREQRLITTHGGRCGVTSQLAGLADEAPLSVTSITALAPTAPGLFLSCMEDKYAYQGSKFNVAILLNAHHPGAPPPGLWSSTPVPGPPA